MIHIVLYQPEIPPNTGNIARLCVCNDLTLHLVHPLGFSIDKAQVKRAGLDYWDKLTLFEHQSWEAFLETLSPTQIAEQLFFFSSKTRRSYWDIKYPKDVYLVFGSETKGLSSEIYEAFKSQLVTLPMASKEARCLNLSNSVSIAAYEVMRQLQTN